jgi:hypothetical protein
VILPDLEGRNNQGETARPKIQKALLCLDVMLGGARLIRLLRAMALGGELVLGANQRGQETEPQIVTLKQ